MSPLVQRPRGRSARDRDYQNQHWSMLVFESLSAGALAMLVGMVAVMAVVGVYAIVVWPLTSWDLSNSGLEKYGALANTALWSVFAGGSLVGFWCFSGAAFLGKTEPRGKTAAPPTANVTTAPQQVLQQAPRLHSPSSSLRSG